MDLIPIAFKWAHKRPDIAFTSPLHSISALKNNNKHHAVDYNYVILTMT